MKVKFSDKSYYDLTEKTIRDLKTVYKNSLIDIEEDLKKLYKSFKGKKPSLVEGMKYDRLKTLKRNVLSDLNILNAEKIKRTQKLLTATYSDAYFKAGYDVQKQVGFVFDFDTINYPAVLELIKNPIPDLSLGNVYGNQKQQLMRKINLEISQGLMQGIGYIAMADKISERLGVDFSAAKRTAWTEGHRVLQTARYDSLVKMEDEGLNGKKKWLATLDSRTRPTHQTADGQERKMKEYYNVGSARLMFPGDSNGGPAETIHCRCSELYIINDEKPLTRRAGGETIEFKNYDEWKATIN